MSYLLSEKITGTKEQKMTSKPEIKSKLKESHPVDARKVE